MALTTANVALHLNQEMTKTPSRDTVQLSRRKSRLRHLAALVTGLLLCASSARAQCNPCDSNPNGFVAVPFTGCREYVNCQNGQAAGSNQSCNSGLIFDPNIKGCNWENQVTCPPDPKKCDSKEKEVGSKEPSCDTPICSPGQSGIVVVPYTNCGQYVTCSNGVAGSPQYCSQGLMFSPPIQACNVPSLVVCPPDPTCPPTVTPTLSPTVEPESLEPSEAPTESPYVPSQNVDAGTAGAERASIVTADLLEGIYVIDAHLDANKILITRDLFNGGRPITPTSSTFDYNSFKESLHTMITTPIGNKSFYIGSGERRNGRVYGLVNVAAFLSQAVVDSIQYGSCDEINTDLINGVMPISNACGQNGIDYQDSASLCLPSEEKYACETEWEMRMQAENVGSDSPPFSCGPAKDYGGFTGFWDYVSETENKDMPTANGLGKTDVQGCCWWGRGVLHTKGVCQYGKLNHFIGKKAADEGRPSMFPDIDFCVEPNAVCSHEKNIKWITGLFRWVMDVQTYNVEEFSYIDELINFVDGGFEDWSFIHRVSGIVSQGCHKPPCVKGSQFDGVARKDAFIKTLKLFGLKVNTVSENSRRLRSQNELLG